MASKHAKYNAINTLSTNNGMAGRFSRNDILDWVKVLTGFQNYGKIEQLCDGIAYCYIMNKMFPNSFSIVRVKDPAYNEVEKLHNMKLLQVSFLNCNVDHEIPMHLLVKGKFQDNFEFAVWFKKFADLNLQNVSTTETDKTATNTDKQINYPSPFKLKKSIKVLREKSNVARDKTAAAKPFFAKPNFSRPAFDDSENQMPPVPSPMKIKAMQHMNKISDLERELSEREAENFKLKAEIEAMKINQIKISQPQTILNASEKEAITDIIEAISGCPDDHLPKSSLNEILCYHGLIENEDVE